jgi:DNA-binding PucR family transcriptional regulator
MSTVAMPGTSERASAPLRDQLSNLQALLVLSMLMTESSNENSILQLAATSVPSLGRCHTQGVYLPDGGWRPQVTTFMEAEMRVEIESQLDTLSTNGGALTIDNDVWIWAFPLRSLKGHIGYLVVGAAEEPSSEEQFLLRVLAQQTGVALANAQHRAQEQATAEELRTANAALAETLGALERSTAIHERLTQVAVAGEGQEGIARAVHDLTGYPVAVEDRYGNLRAWAGSARPDPYPKDATDRREQMLRRALKDGRPIREGDRLLSIASLAIESPGADVLGVLAIVDPEGEAGEQELVALEHGATLLAMELARLRSVAETELRVRRDLVEELLAGTDEESALSRAQALSYDLERPHRVVVVEGPGRSPDDAFFDAVRRAARDTGIGTLLVARAGTVVVLSPEAGPWERFRAAVLSELGGGRCRMGVGGLCGGPADFPRSYREARHALKMQDTSKGGDAATAFDDLGVYRILAEVEDLKGIERFVQDWLGLLLNYDAKKGSELVTTLSRYLECGGSYDATAKALSVHRSTLKYRLQRIREISGHDLACPDTHFNLQLATRAWHTLSTLRAT